MDVIPPGQWLKQQLRQISSPIYLPLYAVMAWLFLYFPTFRGLFDRWTAWDQSMAHGIPVMLAFIWFLYRRLPWVVKPSPAPGERWMAFAALAGFSFLWSLVQQVHIDIFEQLLLLPLLVCSFWLLFGFRGVWENRLLFVLPVFAIPVWDYLNGPLLSLSSEVVGQMVRWVKMPATIQGNSIFIPHGHILIADGCSGLRYLVVALALAYMIALLNRANERHLFVLLLVASILGLVTNWLRIFILVVVGYKTEMQSSLMADHEYFGWLLFAMVCLPALYWAPVVKHPKKQWDMEGDRSVPPSWRWIFLAFLAMALGPAVSAFSLGKSPGQVLDASVPVGAQLVPPGRMPMAVTAPEADLTQSYFWGGAYFRRDQYIKDQPEEKLVPYIPRLYDAERWQPVRNQSIHLSGRPVSWTWFREKGTNRYLVQGQWFEVGDYHTDSVLKAKLWQIAASLKGGNRFSINSLQADCRKSSCHRMQSELQALLEARWSDSKSGIKGGSLW